MTDPPSVRPSSGWRRPGPWLLAALVLAAVAIPGGLADAHLIRTVPPVGYARPLADNVSFSVNMSDAPAYTPNVLTGTAGGAVNVSVALNNLGALAHTFTLVNVSASGTPLPLNDTPAELNGYFAATAPTIAVNVSAHTLGYANFSLPLSKKFRSLEFVSTIPYQFQAGMWGFLNLTPTGPTVQVNESTTDSFSFVPNVLSGPANATGAVIFDVEITNQGTDGHTFTVSSQVNGTISSIGGYFQQYPPLINVSVPGSSTPVWANFTAPAVGVYEYVCTISGHFQQGMFGFLYVGVPVPPAPPPLRTALVEVPILVGSAVLLGIGIALALGTNLVGRLPKQPRSGDMHHGR